MHPFVPEALMIASAVCAGVALYLALSLGRSVRGGFSGKIGTYVGLLPILAAAADLWALALAIGWWTIAAFVVVSLIAGVTVGRANLGQWVIAQPLVGLLLLVFTGLAWGLRYL